MQEITSGVVSELFWKRTKFFLTKIGLSLSLGVTVSNFPAFLVVVFYTVIVEPETVVHCQVDSLK